MKILNKIKVLFCALFLSIAFSSVAKAEVGWVSGTWTFWNKNGNYCPSFRDCTGAKYRQSQYDARQPLKKIEVFIEHESAGIIGRGLTDRDGKYKIQWSVPGVLPNKNKTRVWVRPWHGEGRFRIKNVSNQYPKNQTSSFTIQAGTTEASPQERGSWCVGACTSSSPDPYYNVYWALEMSWSRRLGTSGWFNAYLTNTDVRGFQDDIPDFLGSCRSSCASGNAIQLDAQAAYMPMARAMHELGHVAIYNSQSWTPSLECYNKNNHDGWDYESDEWACAAFEEAFASFLADSTMYGYEAVSPLSCISASYCTISRFNIETSSGSSCSSTERNWPLSAQRFLWDIFDDKDDGETISEGRAGRWWRMYRVYQHYPSGTGAYQNDEHWNSSYTALDAKNGRGAVSYQNNYSSFYSFDVSAVRALNCSPR